MNLDRMTVRDGLCASGFVVFLTNICYTNSGEINGIRLLGRGILWL